MKKKIAIITGAAGFLGYHHCKKLIEKNYHIIALDNNSKGLKDLDKKFNKNTLRSYKIDLTKFSEIKKFKSFMLRNKIEPNVLINNAAIDAVPKITKKKELNFNLKNWNREMAVGLMAPYLLTQIIAEKMKKNKQGSIINIGSDLSVIAPNQKIYKKAFKNYVKPASYSVIKHGLLGLTKYFSSLYAIYGIRCNMISPGPIDKGIKNKFTNELKKIIPMNRLTPIKNILKVLELLIDDHSDYITGQNFIIDGGRTII